MSKDTMAGQKKEKENLGDRKGFEYGGKGGEADLF